jgi:large subunit ribosomal protein L25
MELTIECQKRPEGSKPRALRRSGLIPAVLYGHNGTESVALTMNAKEAEILVKKATVNNTLLDVNVPDMSWRGKALLREVQSHPWKRDLYHLSFFSVAAHDTIDVMVPLHFVGDAPGVKTGKGVLESVVTELHVKCPTGSIPETIDVDISSLEIGDSLRVDQLALPEGVTALVEPQEVVVTVAPPRTAAEAGEETTASA